MPGAAHNGAASGLARPLRCARHPEEHARCGEERRRGLIFVVVLKFPIRRHSHLVVSRENRRAAVQIVHDRRFVSTRGARHAGRLGPAWGSHFHPASGPSPAASSCSLRQNLAAPKLRRDHRITDGGGLRSAAKGLARAKSWTASPASEAPRPPGSAPWLAMGRAPALGRAAAPQPN